MIPGTTWFSNPLGADAGDNPMAASHLKELEGAGDGAPWIWSVSHNLEQLVFQNPILSLLRS